MKTEISLINKTDDICEQFGNNSEAIIAAAEELGCRTDSWYIAAKFLAQREVDA